MVTRYPLLRPSIAFIAGILFASIQSVDWRIGFCAVAAIGAAACFSEAPRRFLMLGGWVLVGASLLSFRLEPRNPLDLRNILDSNPQLATIRGILAGEPERKVLEQDGRTRYRTTARVRVSELERRDLPEQAAGEVAVSTIGFLPDEFVDGARVEISGVLAPPQKTIAPGLFDFESYLKWQRIHFVLRAESTNDWKLVSAPTSWSSAIFYRKFNDWARQTLGRGIPIDENTRLLWAMALGWRPGFTNEISEPFMRTGTLHIFAISGLHIAMIGAILIHFLQGRWIPGRVVGPWLQRFPDAKLGFNRKWAGALVIPTIWFYTAATGWQASAIRSTIMCSVIIAGWIIRRPNNLLNSLSASALLILLWQPEQLFQPGFQLSFLLLTGLAIWPGLAAGGPWPDPGLYLGQADPGRWEKPREINLWTKFLARAYEVMTGRDAMLPSQLRPEWRRKLDWFFEWLLGGTNVSLASLAVSLPVIAYYFNLASLSSLAANLVVVPLSGMALACSMASLLLAPVPLLPEIANFASWETMRLMVWFCRWLESFPWTYRYLEAPGPLVFAAYYAALITLLAGWWRKWQAGLAVGMLAILAAANSIWTERTTTTITLLPGSGVIFVDPPGTREDLLVNCGRDREAAVIVNPFLRTRGVDTLSAILLTHGEIEQVEGYPRLAREVSTKVTITSAARSRSPKFREIIRDLEATPEQWQVVAAGDVVGGWRVLHPPAGRDFSRADDEAVVLAREIQGVRIVLLSELGRNGQQLLAEDQRVSKADIVFAGAPVDGQALRPPLLEALQPKLVVFAGNSAPSQRALRELRARGVKAIATSEQQAIVLRARRGRVVVEGMRGASTTF